MVSKPCIRITNMVSPHNSNMIFVGSISSRNKNSLSFTGGSAFKSMETNKGSPSGYTGGANHSTTAISLTCSVVEHVIRKNFKIRPYNDLPYVSSHHMTSQNTTSHHMTSHQLPSHVFPLYHIISHGITPHHTSYHTTWYHTPLHHTTSHPITSHQITPNHITPYDIPSHQTTPYQTPLPVFWQ